MVVGEPENEEATAADWTSPAELDVSTETIDPRILFMGYIDPDPGIIGEFELPAVHHGSSAASFSSRVELLKTDIVQVAAEKPGLGSQVHHEDFNEFFTLANFHGLVMAFFRRRQLLARMIHSATFQPAKVEPALLLAIALCGEAYTTHTTTNAPHRPFTTVLQYLADKLIFGTLRSCPPEGEPRINLELCQAAYLITVLQISSNNAEARRKAVTKRQPALMDALRRSHIIGARRSNVHDIDWEAFVYEESCNRLAAFALFNEGLLALFCNRHPSTTVTEMLNAMPCHDDPWEAVDEDAFISKQLEQTLGPSCASMQLVLKGLLGDLWDTGMFEAYAHLNVFDLYATIGCFQLLLLHHRAGLMLESSKAVLLRAIDRWERLWSEALARVTPEKQRWLGVARYAPEFALASRIIIQVSTNGADIDSAYLKCTPQHDLQAFHQFLLQHS